MLKNYIKIAFKVLLRRKFFTVVSLFGISCTLLVLMIATAFFEHFSRPAEPGTKMYNSMLIAMIELKKVRGDHGSSVMHTYPSYYFIDRYVKSMITPKKVSIHSRPVDYAYYLNNKKNFMRVKYADAAFWDITEFDFVDGRPFNQSEVDNAAFVIVITDRLAREYFGSFDPIGKEIELANKFYKVVGVIPNEEIPSWEAYADAYVPVTTSEEDLNNPRPHGRYTAHILADDRDSFAAIKKEIKSKLWGEAPEGIDEYDSVKVMVGTLAEVAAAAIFGGGPDDFDNAWTYAIITIILLMILFMLLPSINLVNINISRIIERSSEIGIRKAFGASAKSLVVQFIVENLILTIIGGVIGFILSYFALDLITDSGLLPFGNFSINIRIFLLSLGITVFFGLFSGVYPAYKMSRLHPVEALRGVDL